MYFPNKWKHLIYTANQKYWGKENVTRVTVERAETAKSKADWP